LLGLWGLPVPVVEAIALHHSPGKCTHAVFSPLTAVHAADALVHAHQRNYQSDASEDWDLGYLEKLGLCSRLEHWRAAAQNNLRPQPMQT
jgi:HD-like signal output (HDOD) protein